MTYEQYWYDDVWLVETFREAHKERIKQKNFMLHLQGAYFYDALSCALGNAFKKKGQQPFKYPEKPYELFREEREQSKKELEEKEAIVAKLYMENMFRVGRSWGKNNQK